MLIICHYISHFFGTKYNKLLQYSTGGAGIAISIAGKKLHVFLCLSYSKRNVFIHNLQLRINIQLLYMECAINFAFWCPSIHVAASL